MPRISGLKACHARLAGIALLLSAILGGCDAIYDDTKGWAHRLEASILETAHDMGEPKAEDAATAGGDAGAVDAAAEEMAPPPAVPVEPVGTVALAAEAPPSLMPPAKAEEAPAVAVEQSRGAMAAASDALLAGKAEDGGMSMAAAETPAQAATPPLPKSKPAVPAAAEKAMEPPVTPPGDAAVAMVLHLSSLRSEEAAKREWSDLQHSFPDPLGHMQAEFRRTDLGDKGTFYRVLAGPLPSREEAKQTCAALKAKDAKQYCRVMPQKPKA